MNRTHRSIYPACIMAILVIGLTVVAPSGCNSKSTTPEVSIYCAVDEPYASKVLADFEQETGIHVVPQYDIESSKSVGLAAKIEAERDRPHADVWWGNEAFLTVRLADEGMLEKYVPPTAADVQPQFKDPDGFWTGVGLRARVLAVGNPPPGFQIKNLDDLADPRLKDRVAMARPTAGATGAHLAALYAVWGIDKTEAFCKKLHDNGIALLGGNAEVADQVGKGIYTLGLTDNDDVADASANGGRLSLVLPDQDGLGTLAMPATVALIKGAPHADAARKLIDYLVSRSTEQKLLEMKFSRWSVRADGGGAGTIKAMTVDYREASKMYPRAQRNATAILEGRNPE